jgi:hypothetical protein
VRDAILAALIVPPDPDRRRLVVVITDGEDTRSVAEAAPMYEVGKRADSVLHLVLMGRNLFDNGVPVGDPKPFTPRPAEAFRRGAIAIGEWKLMLDTAVVTGGNYHGGSYDHMGGSTSDAVGVFRDIFEEFRQSYVVHYQARGVPAKGWHELMVRVKGVDAKGVRARKGYFAGAQ